jgi:hypothetical protein
MISTADKIQAAHDEMARLKDAARKSVDDIEFYLQAAERAHEAAEMSAELADVAHDTDLKLGQAFALYYLYEEQDCLSGYYYEKHETNTAKEHRRKSRKFICDAITLLREILPEASPTVRESLEELLPSWSHFEQAAVMKELANDARAAWDNHRFIDALDIYRQMATVQEAIIQELPEALEPQYRRIAIGNFVGFMMNASQSLAQISKRSERNEQANSSQVPFDVTVRLLRHTFDAYDLGNTAFDQNPEWEQYRHNAERCLKNIQSILRLKASSWLQLYLAFEDNPDFLKIMKMTDLNKFKKAESERFLRENKWLKLWGVGSFFILLFLIVAGAIWFIVSQNLSWWRLLTLIGAIEAIFILIGAFTLRSIGDLSEENFLKLIGMALTYQFRVFALSRKGEDSEDS